MSHPKGRRAPKNHPALQFSRIFTGTIPAHPATQDNLKTLPGGWDFRGNDKAGNCVAVTWATIRRVLTAVLGGTEVYPALDLVWQVYKTQNPKFDPNGTAYTNGPGSRYDQGMDIQTLLEYLVSHGFPDVAGGKPVKAIAFAKVNLANLEEVKAALSIFGFLWTGINVLAANETQFDQGKPWDWSTRSQQVGGHSVTSAGYRGKTLDDVEIETWAKITSFTDNYWNHGVEEAWVVIYPEHLGSKAFQDGIDLVELADAYQELTGQTLVLPDPPAPTPTPTPTPTPAPTVDPADKALADAFDTYAKAADAASAAFSTYATAFATWRKHRGV